MSRSAIAEGLTLSLADDTSLAARFAGGDADALEQVIALYQGRVARLASRLLGWRADVDDVVQDVFVTALSKAHTFRRESSLWTWLTAITVNRCRSQQRRAALFERFSRWTKGTTDRVAPAADLASLGDETSTRVRAEVAALPAKDREAVVLFYLEQRTAAEISALLGVSINAFEVRLHRARKRLKAALADLVRE